MLIVIVYCCMLVALQYFQVSVWSCSVRCIDTGTGHLAVDH